MGCDHVGPTQAEAQLGHPSEEREHVVLGREPEVAGQRGEVDDEALALAPPGVGPTRQVAGGVERGQAPLKPGRALRHQPLEVATLGLDAGSVAQRPVTGHDDGWLERRASGRRRRSSAAPVPPR